MEGHLSLSTDVLNALWTIFWGCGELYLKVTIKLLINAPGESNMDLETPAFNRDPSNGEYIVMY